MLLARQQLPRNIPIPYFVSYIRCQGIRLGSIINEPHFSVTLCEDASLGGGGTKCRSNFSASTIVIYTTVYGILSTRNIV